MKTKEYKDFVYARKSDYDKTVKVNEDELKAYSKKRIRELYPDGCRLAGETYESKKRDKQSDIGRIELNEKRLYVVKSGSHNKLFRRQDAFVEIADGGFIALLKLRLLPIIIAAVLLVCGIAGGVWGIIGGEAHIEGVDPGIRPVETEILTVSGTVTKDGKTVENATLSLQCGNAEIAHATTDKDGKYLIGDVANGIYNLVCTYKDSVLTKMATVNGASVIIGFAFDTDENTDVKAIVKVSEKTPATTVGGLDVEAMLHTIVGKEVDITLLAEMLDDDKVPEADKDGITAISGELKLTYFDFSLLKEVYMNKVLESSEYLKNAETVLEVAVAYDSSRAIGTYVFRCHDGNAERFTELDEKPTNGFADGTYYVSADTVYVYTNCFSTYAIGYADAGHTVKGSDTITYSDRATVNLKTGKITMLYKHDADSTNDARIEIYLVGDNGNLLVSESGIIPVGYQISEMTLKSGVGMPSVGTYRGLMKIIYLGTDGNTATNVDIPLNIVITQ